MSIELDWYIKQGGVNPHPMGTERVAKSQYDSRLRIAKCLASNAGLIGADKIVFVSAVMDAPAAIYHGNGRMSPIDFESIGLDAVRKTYEA